jgi:hypothetical protein
VATVLAGELQDSWDIGAPWVDPCSMKRFRVGSSRFLLPPAK